MNDSENLKRLFIPHLPKLDENGQVVDKERYVETDFSHAKHLDGELIRWTEKFVNEKGEELIYQCKSCFHQKQHIILFDTESDFENKKRGNQSEENRLFKYFMINDINGNVYKNTETKSLGNSKYEEYINYKFDNGSIMLEDYQSEQYYYKAEARDNDFEIFAKLYNRKNSLNANEVKVFNAVKEDHPDFEKTLQSKHDAKNNNTLRKGNAEIESQSKESNLLSILRGIVQVLLKVVNFISELPGKFIDLISCSTGKDRGDHKE